MVMVPLTMPNFSSSTLTKGARQLVVHEALEMMASAGGGRRGAHRGGCASGAAATVAGSGASLPWTSSRY